MEQPTNERVKLGFARRVDGKNGVAIAIPQVPIYDPKGAIAGHGLILTPSQARELAYNLLLHAEGWSGESIFLAAPPDVILDPIPDKGSIQ